MTEARTQDQFLAAYNDIEQYLKGVVYGGREAGNPGFKDTLTRFLNKHPRRLTRSQADTLDALSKVRNLMAHSSYFEGRLPVDPTEAAVRIIQGIRDHLISPATAMGVLGARAPLSITPEMTVREALRVMHEHDFSQVPVYSEARYVGLLTNNAIARWIGSQMEEHGGLAEDAPSSAVLPFAEEVDRVEVVPRDVSALEAVGMFADAALAGSPLTALLVTHSGKLTEKPISIIVAADLPRLASS